MDLAQQPERIDDLTSRGILKMPVASRGDEFIIAQDLGALAEFIGVVYSRPEMLPPDVLVERYRRVLAVATDLVSAMPYDLLRESAHPERARDVLGLGFHTIDICPKMIEGYPTRTIAKSTEELRPPWMGTAEKLRAFGQEAAADLTTWWQQTRDTFEPSSSWNTYYGAFTSHAVLERQVWHSAQHTRQLHDVTRRAGLDPVDALSIDDLAGLPLPERVWE